MSPDRLTPSIPPSLPFPPSFSSSHLSSQPCKPPSSPTPTPSWCSIIAISWRPCRPYFPYLPECISSFLLLFLLLLPFKKKEEKKRIITVSDLHPNGVTSALLHQQRPLGAEIMTVSWCCLSGLPFLLSQGESSWHCSTPFFSTVRLPPPPPPRLCSVTAVCPQPGAPSNATSSLMESPRGGPTDTFTCVFNEGVFLTTPALCISATPGGVT